MNRLFKEYLKEADENPANIILSVSELVRKDADSEDEVAKTSIPYFLMLLKNAGLPISYAGLKSYYNAHPELKNVIQTFNDSEIIFVGQGDEKDGESLGEPQGEVPPDEVVDKMAKRAMKARESIEEAAPPSQAQLRTDAYKKSNAAGNFLRKPPVKPVTFKTGSQKGQDEDYRNPVAKNAAKQAQLLRTKASNITTGGPDNLDAIKVVSPAAQALANKQKQAAQAIEKKNNIMPQTAAKPDTTGINLKMQTADINEIKIGTKAELIALNKELEKAMARKDTKKAMEIQAELIALMNSNKGVRLGEDEYAALDSFTNSVDLTPEEEAKIAAGPDAYEADEKLMAKLMDHFSDGMPYGTAKGRDGDPYEFIFQELDNMGLIKEDVYGGSPAPMNTIDKVQSIMDNGSAMKIDGVMVDTFTASVIMAIYNKVNEKNQDKMRSMPVEKLASSAYKLANRFKEDVDEGYYEMPPMDRDRYTDLPGLEGPFQTRSGKVVYYDPKEGKYYDRDSDMYLSYDEFKDYDQSKPEDFKMTVKMPKAMQKEDKFDYWQSADSLVKLAGIKERSLTKAEKKR